MDAIQRIKLLEDRLTLLKTFSKHSAKGVRCPKCDKFVPLSAKTESSFICPYPGCDGDCNSSPEMRHPVSFVNRNYISMNKLINNDKKKEFSLKSSIANQKEYSEKFCDTNDNAYEQLAKNEDFAKKFTLLKDIILAQKKANGFTRKIPIKACMFDAFLNTLEAYPDEMINYLTSGGQLGNVCIQSILFQEFASLINDILPLTVYSKGDEIYIDNPLDERLHLYNGIREFNSFIDANLQIKKRMQNKIVNDVSVPDNEDSFLGMLVSVKDTNGNDLINYVDAHTFTSIKMLNCEEAIPGTDVFVKYYSIQASYTLGSMIHLQRIKRKIKDSIIRKLDTDNIKQE